MLALAGGPGQAANPLAELHRQGDRPRAARARPDRLRPARHRALGPAQLHQHPRPCNTRGTVRNSPNSARCSWGPRAGRSRARNRRQDIEAIRQALGYEKLVLYGTSYGTKVALEYAERYPEHVEALVLDSVVLPEGPEPFALPSIQALAPVLDELCSEGACAHITSNPLGDVAALAARLRRHPLSGLGVRRRRTPPLRHAPRARPVRHPARRRPQPGAARAAARRGAVRAAQRPLPAAAPEALSEGLIPNVPLQPRGSQAEREANEEEDNALFLATSCEEKPFPWQRAAAPATRDAEALAALHALPSSDFYPFDAATAWEDSLVPVCKDWPNASPAPPAASPLPNVPTLMLSGAQDLRTPTSGARAVAARIPDAQLLVVPYTGHSVLGSDFGDCAARPWKRSSRAGWAGSRSPRASANPTPSAPPPSPPRASPTCSRSPACTARRTHPHSGARHDRGPRAPGDRGDAAGPARTAHRIQLRRPARGLRPAERLRGEPARPHVRARGCALRHPSRERGTPAQHHGARRRRRRRARHRHDRLRRARPRLPGRPALRREHRPGASSPGCRPPAPTAGGLRLRSTSRCRAWRGCHSRAGVGARPSYSDPMPNALAQETSPYLRQHASNPVDWLPWGPQRWRRRASATCRCWSRSGTRPATGAT